MFKKLYVILECSRVFSLPMTVMSWLVVFIYAVFDSGNVLYGLLALLGISLVHLATNIFDDYVDYKHLINQVGFDKKEYLKNTQKTKCRYIISGLVSENEILQITAFYLLLASLIGLFFLFKCGVAVIYFALLGGLIALLYSFVSRIKMSEIAVALAYGPLLFGGVYYVMTQTLDTDVFILSIPTMIVTVVLLYVHTVMDYDYDLNEGKKTIANSFDSQLDSLIVLKYILIFAYISPILLCIFDITDWQVFLVYLTIPLAIDLYSSMESFASDTSSVPMRKWYNFPMENYNKLKASNALPFMYRMYQARNLLVYYAALMSVAIAISLY